VESSKRGRRAIFVDGVCVLDLPKAFVDELGLRVGQSLLPDEQDAIGRRAARYEARLAAVKALGRRALTRAELQRKLLACKLPEQAVRETLDWLAERKYLDDAVRRAAMAGAVPATPGCAGDRLETGP